MLFMSYICSHEKVVIFNGDFNFCISLMQKE